MVGEDGFIIYGDDGTVYVFPKRLIAGYAVPEEVEPRLPSAQELAGRTGPEVKEIPAFEVRVEPDTEATPFHIV